MIDGHIHLEYGDYTLEYIQKFVDKAVEMQLDEIWLLEIGRASCRERVFRAV